MNDEQRIKFEAGVWGDLFKARIDAENAWDRVIRRAELWRETGLVPLEKILEALDLSRATYYRKVAETTAKSQGNLAAAREADRRDGERTRRLFGPNPLVHFTTGYPDGMTVCKLPLTDGAFTTGQAPDTTTDDYREATCPACRDYTRDWPRD